MIYVTGDMHGDLERFKCREIRRLRKGDTLIVCGDFGFVWDGGKSQQKILKKLGRQKYNIAFVDGVYENHATLADYPVTLWNGGKVHNICGNLFHLMRGQVFTLESKVIFAMGGGENPHPDNNSPMLEGCLPNINEILVESYTNLEKAHNIVDYIITHDCSGTVKHFLDMDSNTYNNLNAFFNNLAKDVHYKKWYFGCHHIDKIVPPKYVGVYKEVHRLE